MKNRRFVAFVKDPQAKGTPEKVLPNLGWKRQQKPAVNHGPPSPPAGFLNRMGKEKRQLQAATQPMTLAFAQAMPKGMDPEGWLACLAFCGLVYERTEASHGIYDLAVGSPSRRGAF